MEGAAVEGESPESLEDSEVNERHKSFRVTKREKYNARWINAFSGLILYDHLPVNVQADFLAI